MKGSPPLTRIAQAGSGLSLSGRGEIGSAREALLSIEAISLSFGGVKALTDVSFDIAGGEIRAIIGPNGAGKTSMLDNIMAGRTLRMGRGFFWQMLRFGPALAEEVAHRRKVEDIIDFLEIPHIRKVPVGRLP